MVEIKNIEIAVEIIQSSRFTTAFTGAGISVESGIPSFRGPDGIWNKYDPKILDIHTFIDNPSETWKAVKEIFYDFFDHSVPNQAHITLAEMEKNGLLGRIITQNIDNLHQEAGSKQVFEFHGNSKKLVCLECKRLYLASEISLDHIPPTCRECGGLLKPNFVFFGEGIPQNALSAAYEAADISDLFLIIGTTGEVMPANLFPKMAKSSGAKIIEINPQPSLYTHTITDVYLQGKAGEIMGEIGKRLFASTLNDNQ